MSSNSAELQNFLSINANFNNSRNTTVNSYANIKISSNNPRTSYAKFKNLHAYDDIIDTPYPFPSSIQSTKTSTKNTKTSIKSTKTSRTPRTQTTIKKPRERIPLDVRAAEFAPFAALTGYHETIDEVSTVADDPNRLTVELFAENQSLTAED